MDTAKNILKGKSKEKPKPELKQVKPKSKQVKPKLKKVKPEPKQVKPEPKQVKSELKQVKSPVKRRITVEYSSVKDTLDENKYSGKLNKLLYKIKSQNTDTDNGIRFCWKN